MRPRYTEPITIKEARTFLKHHFGDRATIPHGSRCVWVAGVRWVTDQPGCYLWSGEWGLEGVMVIAKASEGEKAA